MATPAAIAKLTEHATRARGLMAKTEKAAEASGPILDNYDATLTRYMAHLSRVKDEEKQLAAVLQGMGNAIEVIDGAFQDEKPDAAKASVTETQRTVSEAAGQMPARQTVSELAKLPAAPTIPELAKPMGGYDTARKVELRQ